MPNAAEEARAAANQNSNPAGGQPTGQPTGQPAGQPQGGLPAEYAGKSAEDIYKSFSEKYKDYDSLKTRAESAAAYEKLNLPPDKIQETMTWVQNLLDPMMNGGKVAKWDKQNNRILFIDEQGNVTQAPAGQQPNQNPFEGYELLDESTKASKLSEYVFDQKLTPRINEIVKNYDNQFRTALGAMEQRMGMFMDVLDRWAQNPKLKPRELLAKMMDLAKNGNNPSGFLDMAERDLLSPAQMEEEVEKRVAARLAEEAARRPNPNDAPILDTPFSMRARGMFDGSGKKLPMNQVFANVLAKSRENGASR